VEVLFAGAGELVCCGQPMELQVEHTEEEMNEKHLPVATRDGDVLKVKVGSGAHPMEEKHYIEWIQVISGDTVLRKFLNPGEEPEAVFDAIKGKVDAREYCNIHGLWKSVDL
ncbi:MAG: desulfoferrodoxin, partial [Elusimicrobia bacterium]|nr:desulfoferrodoxin [Elusimicrobiota bacterium]